MKSKHIVVSACAALALLPAALNAQVVFSDVGMTSSAGYTVNNSFGALNANPIDYQANFGVSYTADLGVPQSPFSSSTTALQLKVNETSANQAAVSVSPTSLSLSGSFTMTFDMWWNYNSGGFTAGSSQIGSYGLTTAANQVQGPSGVGGGQLFGVLTDNGSSSAYRGYNGGTALPVGAYAAGSQNSSASYYTTLFPSQSVPAGETALDANQSGSSAAGTPAFAWHQVNVTYDGSILSESIDGTLIASYATASIGSDVFLGLFDINNSGAGVTGLADQNYVLFNNLVVSVPEPATCALAVLGATGLFLARRRKSQA